MLVIAHRGASADRPENTLAATDRAIELSADWIEDDVQLTADGHVVVIHDRTLARTTDVAAVFPGRRDDDVATFTLDELRCLDAGAGERIPTLGEQLDRIAGRATLLVELKAPSSPMLLVEGVAAAIDDRPVVVQSFDRHAVLAFAALRPDVPVALLVVGLDDLGDVSGFAYVNPHERAVDADAVARLHDLGVRTTPWTVDDPVRMAALVAAGVDGLITNRPDVLIGLLGGEVSGVGYRWR